MSLDVVLDDDVDSQITLDGDGEPGEQVLMLLPDIEEHVLGEGLGLLRVAQLQFGDPSREPGVEPLGDVDVLVEPPHDVPEVLLPGERDIVALEFVLAPLRRLWSMALSLVLRGLVLAEVVHDLVPEGQPVEPLLGARGLARVEVFDGPPQLEQGPPTVDPAASPPS